VFISLTLASFYCNVASPSPWDMASPSPSPIRAGGMTPRGATRHDSSKDTPRGREQSHRLQFRSQSTPRSGAMVLQSSFHRPSANIHVLSRFFPCTIT